MKFILTLFAFLLMSSARAADEPCDAFYGPEFFVSGTLGGCAKKAPPFDVKPVPTETNMRARMIINQAKQIAELQSLRAELKLATDKLTEAVNALTKVSTDLVANNNTWQKTTLQETIAAINAMPARLAQEESLQKVLLVTLKEQLEKDTHFVEAVKNASQSGVPAKGR
jgi:hypothetical protein